MAKKRKKTNPNGVNQYTPPDPRQTLFIQNYFDPKSNTFSNALQSALKAGYEQEYAESITSKMPLWLAEKVGDTYMLDKAEKNLKKVLDLKTQEPVITLVGILKDDKGKVVEKENPRLLKIQSDVSQFIAERIGKLKYANFVIPPQTNIQINIINDPDLMTVMNENAKRMILAIRQKETINAEKTEKIEEPLEVKL